MATWTYRSEYVRCGKKACGSCPHGPYWYRYQRRGNKVHKEYVGKIRSDQVADELRAHDGRYWDEYDDILAAGGLTRANALAVLELGQLASEVDAKRAFRRQSLLHHPDRGGDDRKMKAINAAYAYLRSYHGWK